jgi:hypothetical protein
MVHKHVYITYICGWEGLRRRRATKEAVAREDNGCVQVVLQGREISILPRIGPGNGSPFATCVKNNGPVAVHVMDGDRPISSC